MWVERFMYGPGVSLNIYILFKVEMYWTLFSILKHSSVMLSGVWTAMSRMSIMTGNAKYVTVLVLWGKH
jgi:hypothetical protein